VEDIEQYPLLRVCSLLNAAGAKYFVIGGRAVILHGLIRTTQDVDILIEESEDNFKRVIAGLSQMEDHYAAELSPQDFIDNIVVTIGDEVHVDVSTRAWKITYLDAAATALETTINGVKIPYLGLEALIASKQTYREKDQMDLLQLRQLKERK
jgi:predicted nucleotidyltransferase